VSAVSEPPSQRRSVILLVIIALVAVAAVAGCVTGIVVLLRSNDGGGGTASGADAEDGPADRADADGEASAPSGADADGEASAPSASSDATEDAGGIAVPARPGTDSDGDGLITAPGNLPGLEPLDPDRFSQEYCDIWEEIPKLSDPITPESAQARIDGLARAQEAAYPDAAAYYQVSIDYLCDFRDFLSGDTWLREYLIAEEQTFRYANIIVADSSIAACLF
jgi:hypothetical protein